MALDEKLRQINQRFANKGIRVDPEWLSGCVQFFIDEDPTLSVNQLFSQAEEQWDLSDLCDSGIKCLPEQIFHTKGIQNISGTFLVQLQFLLDITESPYDQLQKLQNKEIDIGKEQPEFKQTNNKSKKKRMLKLELTDGFQTVAALEHTQIPCLNTKLTPGIKMLLTGPMRCINHILFLESANVRLLSGEVTSLAIDNAYENVLRKELNLPINPTPNSEYQEAAVVTEATRTIKDIPSIPMVASNMRPKNVSSINHMNAMDDFPDDDFLNDIDIDQIASKVTSSSHQSDEVPTNRRSTLLFDDMDDDDFLNIDSVIEGASAMPENMQIDNPEMALRSDIESVLNTSTDAQIWSDNYRFKIRGLNLVSIKQLNECPSENRQLRKHFIAKAHVDEITQRARVSRPNNVWKLGVLLGDTISNGTTLQATFSNSVVSKLAGVSGFELNKLHDEKHERPQVEDDIQAILIGLVEKLESLVAFLKIEFNDDDHPVVVEVINSAPVLERKLQEKIQYEKLF